MRHSFNTEIACTCGIAAAVLLQNFYFWIELNKQAGRNEIEGRTWTFSTQAALKDLMPYLSLRQIRQGIQRLKDAGYLSTGCYNKRGMDRTIWYTVTDEAIQILEKPDVSDVPAICQNGTMHLSNCNNPFVKMEQCICQNEQIHLSNRTNAFVKMEQAIPDTKHKILNKDTNTDSNTDRIVKKRYAKFVTMTEKEYQKLVAEYGQEMTDECIRILDNYKGSKGRKYKDDYRAILSWVVNSYHERHPAPRNIVADIAEQAKRIMEGGLTRERQDDRGNLFNDDCIRTTAEPV